MKKSKVIVYGVGRFAQYVAYVLSKDSDHTVSAFCVESRFKDANIQYFLDLPVVGFEEIEQHYPATKYKIFIGVGNNLAREQMFNAAKQKGYKFVSYISSKANCWDNLVYGENVFIGNGSAIEPFVTIGDNSILYGVNIGHHAQIGNHVLLSGCYVGGSAVVGDNCFLGLNSAIKHKTVVGYNNIIGMGCTITRNTKDNEIYREQPSTKTEIPRERLEKIYLR